MSAAHTLTPKPSLRIVSRPKTIAMFDMIALDTRPLKQACLPGCGASPANKKNALPYEIQQLVRLGWHAVDLAGIGAAARPECVPFSAWVQHAFKRWRIKPRTHVLCHDAPAAPLTEQAEDLMGLVIQMRMDDAIVCDDWRLELVRMGEGWPHYRLYRGGLLAGIVDIPVVEDYHIAAYEGLEALQWKLCVCMAVAGIRRERAFLYAGEAATPIEASKRDLPYLF